MIGLLKRTLFRILVILVVLTFPILLIITALIDYLKDDYVQDIKDTLSVAPAAFRKGGKV